MTTTNTLASWSMGSTSHNSFRLKLGSIMRNTFNSKQPFAVCGRLIALLFVAQLVSPTSVFPQAAISAAKPINTAPISFQHRAWDPLQQFNKSLVDLTGKVTPAVVQIMVTSYGPVTQAKRPGDVGLFARQNDVGSGVILDSDGYIITNAHVIEGAQRIRVALPVPSIRQPFDVVPAKDRRVLEAKLLGLDKDTDLALLKVEAHGLPTLALAGGHSVYPGEVVIAVGSPEGLQSSVTMGVVSSVWRQPDPSDPAAYIQTDAPINPGNSGGPLVDVDGYVIGLNTMILSKSGGSEGIGFAIPARIVRFVYDSLRKYGHVHRIEIQAGAQEITPSLAEGLGLARDWGVIISDVAPKGPGAVAGLQAGDIVSSVDNRRISGLAAFAEALYLHTPNQALRLDVLRDRQKMSLTIPAMQPYVKAQELADFVDPQNLVDRLGIFVHDLDDNICSALPVVRIASGVVVVAQSAELNSYISSLRAGDILHSLNRQPIESVDQLRSMLQGIKTGQAVALQIEREGRLEYVAFDWGN